MARHLAPFSCRQRMAEMVRRRSFGGVLPLGRHASISGSSLIQCASDTIARSSFQEGQNARHHKRFKLEQALILRIVLEARSTVCRTASSKLSEDRPDSSMSFTTAMIAPLGCSVRYGPPRAVER